MYESLITFLHEQLKLQSEISQQELRMLKNMEFFLAGLCGQPLPTGGTASAPPASPRVSAGAQRDAQSDALARPHTMTCTRRFGAFSLWEHVSAAEPLRPLVCPDIQGGDANSVKTVSMPTTQKEEDIDMKYVTRRADGRWCARKTINGKRICVYGNSQREAMGKLQSVIGKRSYEKHGSMALDKFAMWWLETYKKGNVTDKTYDLYLKTIKSHIKLTTPMTKITTMDLQNLLNAMPLSRIRQEVYKLLRQIFRKAYELDYIKKDVSEFLELGKVTSKSREAIGLDDQRKLWNALGDDMFSRRVRFYLLTGARPAEIATVKKEELRPGWVKINGTKTSNAVRWVKISDKLYKMLMGESPEFFNFDNKRFRQHLQRFCTVNNIKANVDVYTLRHTFATNLYLLRVPEKDRQTYMGHAAGSPMTNGVYTTFTPDTRPEDIKNIFGDWLPEF